MATPATLLELEAPVEDASSEMRADIRQLAARVSVEQQKTSFAKSFGQLETGRMRDRLWWLFIAAALLGSMAHGLKWI